MRESEEFRREGDGANRLAICRLNKNLKCEDTVLVHATAAPSAIFTITVEDVPDCTPPSGLHRHGGLDRHHCRLAARQILG